MNRICLAVVAIFMIVMFGTSAARADGIKGAQTVDAATACGDSDQVCREDLSVCRQQLDVTKTATGDLTKALEECKQELAKKKPAPRPTKTLAPPVKVAGQCLGAHILKDGDACKCEVSKKPDGSPDPLWLVLFHDAKANTYECVLRAEWIERIKALEARLDGLGQREPAADLRAIWMLLSNTPNAVDKVQLLQGHDSIVGWVSDLDSRVKTLQDLYADLKKQVDNVVDQLCEKDPNDPKALPKCKAGGSRFRLELGGRGRLGWRPVAGFALGSEGYLNGVYTFPKSEHGIVVGGYMGGLSDKETGGQYAYGFHLGPRFGLSETISFDVKFRYEQYASVHGAGWASNSATGFPGLKDKGMGLTMGIEPALNVCFNKDGSVCLQASVFVGYTPGMNTVARDVIARHEGFVLFPSLGLHWGQNF